jgi:AcrR family transcriptional regulator
MGIIAMVETITESVDEIAAPKRLNAADRRRQLLNVAKRLFAQNGYKFTTTANIAKAANVTEPILYRHFRSKKNLFLEVINEIRRDTLDQWRQIAAAQQDPMEALRLVANSFQQARQKHGLEYRVAHRALAEVNDRDVTDVLRGFYCDEADFFTELVRRGQDMGRFRADIDPRLAAWSMIRQGLAYSLTEPLGISLYQEPGHYDRVVEITFSMLTK